jgi:hypothetical protein
MVQHRALRRKTRSIIAMVRDATFVSTSTQPLADALAALNPHRRVVPNHGHKIAGLAGARHDAGLRPLATLLLAASDRMQLDAIAPALRAVLARHGDAVELVGIAEAAVALRALSLPVRAQPLMARDDFQRWVAGLVNPIGLIPLAASRFNACKSAVKFFDYALLGVPALCSRVTPYAEVVDQGRTGLLLGDDAAAWEAAIERLLSDVDERRRIAAAAAQWVRDQAGLKHTLAAWRDLFADLPRHVDARPPDAATRVVEALIDTALAIRHSLRRVNRWRLAARSRRRTKPDPP